MGRQAKIDPEETAEDRAANRRIGLGQLNRAATTEDTPNLLHQGRNTR